MFEVCKRGKLVDAVGRYTGYIQRQLQSSEARELRQPLHAGVREIWAADRQISEVLELSQITQGLAGYLCAAKIKRLQALKYRQFLHPDIRDLRIEQAEFSQVLEGSQLLQSRIGDLG